jgi:beta-fructofuranosidase
VQEPDGNWSFLAWRNFAPNGEFMGELSDPYPITIDDAGSLSVNW